MMISLKAMTYRDKNALPSLLHDVIDTIEKSQNSEFVEAYRDFNDGWRIVFKTLFNNPREFSKLGDFLESCSKIESYLENQFDVFSNNHSYFEELCIEFNQQVIYLKDGSKFEL